MQIQDSLRIKLADPQPSKANRSSENSLSFQKIMTSYSKEITKDSLQGLLEEIDQQGQKLSETPTFNELRKYKDLVKKFMGEVSKSGIGMYQTEAWDPYGGSKSLKTVQVLDRKLVELADHVINQQNSSLSILERIGEIKGLLINLYT